MLRPALLLTALLAPSLPAGAQDRHPPGTDCYCTDSTGGRVELGETICLHVGRRSFTAQCQMSLNVPMWREVAEGCVGADLDRNGPTAREVSALVARPQL